MKRLLWTCSLALPLAFASPSCGTILHADRQHQPHSGRLDPNVLILDGLGLLLYVVPGLVAFGVDFYTGAIYLPEGVDKGEGPIIED